MASNKKSITGELIKLRNVRLSFPSLKEPTRPKKLPDSPLSWGATFLLDPKDPANKETIKVILAEIKRLRLEAWDRKGEAHPKEEKLICFGKGNDRTNDDGDVYNGYEDMYFVTAKSKEERRPLILDANKRPITDPKEVDKILYGGCYVNANVNFWVQDNDAGKAIRCGIQAVQYWKEGEAFGGGRASAEDFDDVEEPDGLDGLDDDEDDDLGL